MKQNVKNLKLNQNYNLLEFKEKRMQALESKYELIVDPNQIIVNVSNPKQVKTTLSSHTVYTIQGNDLTGAFDIIRRYSDFDYVRLAMIKNWPGCYIPPIPKKKVIGNNQFLFVETRREGLSDFCKEVSFLKHLWYSSEFQLLIRGNIDVEKSLKQLIKQDFKQISLKYQQKFKSLSVRQPQQSESTRVKKFQESIKKILPLLTAAKQNTKNIIDSYKNNLEQYEVLLKYVFPEYEKNFLSSYVSGQIEKKLIFSGSSQRKLIQKIEEWKKCADEKTIEKIYLLLEKEQRQLDSFQDVFKSRQTYENLLKQHEIKQKDFLLQQNKLNAGKQSLFKSIIKSNIEQEKKEVSVLIDLNQDRIKGLKELCNLMAIMMADYEIPRFQEYKMKKYYETIRIAAEFQIKMANLKDEICDCVLQNQNLHMFETQKSD